MSRIALACVPLVVLGLVGCGGEWPRSALLSRPAASTRIATPPEPAPAAPTAAPANLPAASKDLQPLPIIQHFTGDDPALQSPAVILVQSRQELAAIGSVELINHAIDFDRHCLVVLALGRQSTAGYWGRLTAAQLEGDVLHVQGFANRPAPGQASPQAITCPYAAAVLPKVRAQAVRSDIQSVTGQPLPPP